MERRKRLAVVFDGAGVIYEPVRIVKDIERGEVKQSKLSGIHLADKVGGAFVMLRAEIRELMRGEECLELLSDFLKRKRIPIVVVYKSRHFSDEEVKRVVLSDRVVKLGDVHETISILLNFNILPVIGTGLVVSVASHPSTTLSLSSSASSPSASSSSSAATMALREEEGIKYVISGGLNLFQGAIRLLEELRRRDVAVFIASGDRIEGEEVAPFFRGVPPENIFGMLKPGDKCRLVKRLRQRYEKVIMVGDDKNDYYAMCAADIAVLSLQIEAERPKELFDVADFVVRDVQEVEEIVNNALSSSDGVPKKDSGRKGERRGDFALRDGIEKCGSSGGGSDDGRGEREREEQL
ncbi:MAG: HAD family hydrolase [Candidatus Methanospirare jalkutatii]|nr:HAD family hydrolase [Candidatus Methanospirare jalkutatii]